MRLGPVVAVFALFAVSFAAHADPVTYTLTGNMSGTLGSNSFTDAAVTLTFMGDTVNTQSLGVGFYLNDIGTGTVSVSGLGTATFLSSTLGVVGSSGSAGFTDLGSFNVGILDFGLADYDLTAPFTDTAYFVNGYTDIAGPESTSLGDLTITGGDYQNATTTFTAAITPEPSSVMLLGTGLVSLIGAGRRRFA